MQCTEIGQGISIPTNTGKLTHDLVFVVSKKLSEHWCKLACVGDHLRSLARSEIPKLSIISKLKCRLFDGIFSLFTLDGYGKVVLALDMTTGSST
ncbi:hypothetical protein Tco_0742478 [Tanacetum coccineum]